MTPNQPAENKLTLVDVIHEWLGKSGLRKIWGLEPMNYPDCLAGGGTIKIAHIFLRESEPVGRWLGTPYFTIWPYRVCDRGSFGPGRFSVSVYDPEFFVKLRKELDYRVASNTIICRCDKCEGIKR